MVPVPKIQLRWVGHRLQGAATLLLDDTTLSTAEAIAHDAEHNLGHAMPNIDDMVLRTVTANASAAAPVSTRSTTTTTRDFPLALEQT